ncbi:hypothetical protein RB593_005735 [Gaeumannomyces tritici]
MVLLTITAPMLEVIHEWRDRAPDEDLPQQADGEPSLSDPAVGKPISHAQIIELRNGLREKGCDSFSLERLLVGSTVFVPPPPQKPEHVRATCHIVRHEVEFPANASRLPSGQTDEYKALMARLRRDEEARAYERMVKPQKNPADSLHSPHRFSSSTAQASSFAAVNRPQQEFNMGDGEDEMMVGDVHRQLMLVLNFLLSIFGVAGTLWVLARWWSTPARLLLSMFGAVAVGVAEVGVYYFYVWHLADASKKDKKLKERKTIVQSWVVDPSEPKVALAGSANPDSLGDGPAVRRRKKA